MPITTTAQVRDALAAHSYSTLPGGQLHVSDDLRLAWEALRATYPELPADEFLPAGGRYRFRRWGRLYFHPPTGELLLMPHVDYFQSKAVNRVTGGVVRRFAPLLPEQANNPFLHALVRFDFSLFPLTPEEAASTWQVDVHLIRVTAAPGINGQPTPEGVHRDDAEYVTVHLVEREHVTGGEATVYTPNAVPLAYYTPVLPLDSYYLRDSHVLHSATPIALVGFAPLGVRGILTFDYHLCPTLARPE